MFQVVEDIDVVTLKKVEKLEWERKHGWGLNILFASIIVCGRITHKSLVSFSSYHLQMYEC